MATIAKIKTKLAKLTGISEGTIHFVARRVGEAGLLPRGPRGRHAPNFGSSDITHLLIGMLITADGIEGTASRIGQIVSRVSGFSQPDPSGEIEVKVENRETGEFETQYPAGSFVDVIAFILEEFASGRIHPVERIGLRFTGTEICGVVQDEGSELNYYPANQDNRVENRQVGLVRENWINAAMLKELSEMIAVDV